MRHISWRVRQDGHMTEESISDSTQEDFTEHNMVKADLRTSVVVMVNWILLTDPPAKKTAMICVKYNPRKGTREPTPPSQAEIWWENKDKALTIKGRLTNEIWSNRKLCSSKDSDKMGQNILKPGAWIDMYLE